MAQDSIRKVNLICKRGVSIMFCPRYSRVYTHSGYAGARVDDRMTPIAGLPPTKMSQEYIQMSTPIVRLRFMHRGSTVLSQWNHSLITMKSLCRPRFSHGLSRWTNGIHTVVPRFSHSGGSMEITVVDTVGEESEPQWGHRPTHRGLVVGLPAQPLQPLKLPP